MWMLFQEIMNFLEDIHSEYVKIDVLDISSKFNLVIEEACATALSSADESRLLPYSNSDKELVKIDRIACNTLHDCMQKVFEDGQSATEGFGWEISGYRHLQIMRHIR